MVDLVKIENKLIKSINVIDVLDYKDLVNKVLKCGSINAVDYRGWNLLHYACYYNCYDLVVLLLSVGIDVNVQAGLSKNTPLMMSVLNGNEDIIRVLLESGANTSINDYLGGTVMDIASDSIKDLILSYENGIYRKDNSGISEELRKVLLDNQHMVISGLYENLINKVLSGSDVNTQTSVGWNLLHYAASAGNLEVCQALIRDGIDIDRINYFGESALILVLKYAKRNVKEIVMLLLENNAFLDTRDSEGKSALDYAKEKNYFEIENLLMKVNEDNSLIEEEMIDDEFKKLLKL